MAIDDRDEYEKLFEKNRWKTIWNIVKAIAFIGLMLIAYFLIQIGMGTEGGFTWTMAGFILLCLGSTFMSITRPPEKPNLLTLSVLRCLNPDCQNVLVRDYEDGDFVFKVDLPCSKCTTDMRVEEIYKVKIRDISRDDLIEEIQKKEADLPPKDQ